jgi:hypothetical protein
MKNNIFFIVSLLILKIFFLTGCGSEGKNKIIYAPLDPTDTTDGILQRFLNESIEIKDTLISAKNYIGLKISKLNRSVYAFPKGGIDTLEINYKPLKAKINNLIISIPGKSNYAYIKIDKVDSINSKVYCFLKIDESISPGIFEVKIQLEDINGIVTKPISKWFLVKGDSVINVQNNLCARWLLLKHTNLGNYQHKGHFIDFNKKGGYGEWIDISFQKTYNEKLRAIKFQKNTPYFNENEYKVSNDKLIFTSGAKYHILALTDKRLIVREIAGGADRYGVFAKYKGNKSEN